jgi:type II secretory pathway component PulF
MPNFAYQAVDSAGKARHGEATAVSAGALARSLEERGLLVLDGSVAQTGAA